MPEIKKYLNRDGLEEYNSLLPHSSGEMQEYVNDWLDVHPEATTTVQDGAITEPKLADKSVSLRTLADDTVHMLNGMILTREISGDILTADDAYSAPPMAFTVDGKSTQDGTPTPDAPVPIESVDELALAFAGKNLLDTTVWAENKYIGPNGQTGSENGQHYTENYSAVLPGTYCLSMLRGTGGRIRLHGYDSSKSWIQQLHAASVDGGNNYYSTSITIPDGIAYVRLSTTAAIKNQQLELGSARTDYAPFTVGLTTVTLPVTLRSLPDGTKDTLALSYLRPSTREGWAWYTPTFTRAIDEVRLANVQRVGHNGSGYDYVVVIVGTKYYNSWASAGGKGHITSNRFKDTATTDGYVRYGEMAYYKKDGIITIGLNNNTVATVADAVTWLTENATYVCLRLSNPTTETLDPVELPILPAPDVTVWSDPSTGLKMRYVRDSNIVIQRIEEAIADQ